MENTELTQEDKNLMIGVARRTITKLFKKGRSSEYIENFVNSKRGRDYMANVANFINSSIEGSKK